MIIHGFISRNDDWILAYHLAVYLRFCDRIVVMFDRSTQSEAICRSFGDRVEVHHWRNRLELDDFDFNGVLMEEGSMRQAVWDLCMKHDPELVVLGDTDEVPTPDIADWLRAGPDASVDCWYLDWVNLTDFGGRAIGGESVWSFQSARGNKKGIVVRPRRGQQYRYRRMLQHVRMEPSPLHEGRAIYDAAHRLLETPKLIHWKYASQRWLDHPMRHEPKFRSMLGGGAQVVPVPREWHWVKEFNAAGVVGASL